MPIRFAAPNDVPGLVELGARVHAMTRYCGRPYNPQRVSGALTDIIVRGQGRYALFVAENGEARVVGGLLGVIERQLFSDHWTASVMHLDVLPEARMGGWGVRLLRAFERWANNRHAVEIAFGVTSGAQLEPIARFAGRMGYAKVGENYVKAAR